MSQQVMLKNQLNDLKLGDVTGLLRSSGPSEWPRFATARAIEANLDDILAEASRRGVRRFNPRQVASLATRLLLARDAKNLEMLSALWCGFGASKDCCARVVAAVKRVLSEWPGGISRGSDSLTFSPAPADFLVEVQDVCQSRCALCEAIRAVHLCGEEWPGGFPAVVKGNVSPWLASSVWVPLVRRRARTSPKSHWGAAWRSARKALREIPSNFSCPSLAPWFEGFIRLHDGAVETLASASLATLCEALAWHQGRRLPFGVGFTGSWDEHGKLSGVTDLNLKLQAAADAGIFLLFACQHQAEPDPDSMVHLQECKDASERVRLVLLPQSSLDEVIRQINQVCAESGITEYRWRREDRKLRATSVSAIGSRDLPKPTEAATDDLALPVGFVGREQPLERLRELHAQTRQANGRRICVIVGAPRTGKTELLGKWAGEQPFFPVWFSFHRWSDPRSRLDQMRRAIADQIVARFAVLNVPVSADDEPDEASTPKQTKSLENALAATDAQVDIVIDGLDEAESADERERIICYFQNLQGRPGNGTILIGSQHDSRALLGRIGASTIELSNEDHAGTEDAAAFIERFAEKFDRGKRGDLAKNLRIQRWRDTLVARSGGNLAVLTAVMHRASDFGWPERPEELLIGQNPDEYFSSLLDHVKQSFPCEFDFLDELARFHAFLDNRPWDVKDVLKLMGRNALRALCGSGSRAIQELFEISDGNCRFRTNDLHDSARQYYDGYACLIVERAIKLLDDLPHPVYDFAAAAERAATPYIAQRGPGPGDLADYLVRQLPGWADGLTNDAGRFVEALSRSTWLYRRLRAMAHDGVIDSMSQFFAGLSDLAQLHESGELTRRDQQWLDKVAPGALSAAVDAGLSDRKAGRQLASTSGDGQRWTDVLHELLKLHRAAPRSELADAIDFLSTWGWAIVRDRQIGIGAWWDAAPALRHFPRGRDIGGGSGPTLLVPFPDGYDRTGWPTGERLLGFACELPAADRPLVLAAAHGPVFRKRHARHERDRFIRLNHGEQIDAVAALSATEVAVLIRSRFDPDEIRVFDATTSAQRTLIRAGDNERFDSVHTVSKPQPACLVVLTQREGSIVHYKLRAYSVEGEPEAEIQLESIRPRELGRVLEIAVVPFADGTWAAAGLTGANSSRRLVFQRLVKQNGRWEIETFGPSRDAVNGECALPDARLAVACVDQDGTYLEVFDSSGNRLVRNRLDSATDDPDERELEPQATTGSFPAGCRPVAWHKGLGVLLTAASRDDQLWHVWAEPEAMPEPVPAALTEQIGNNADSAKRCFLSLSDGTALVTFASGALIAGPGRSDAHWIIGGVEPGLRQEILGVRPDGGVAVRESAWLDQCAASYEPLSRHLDPHLRKLVSKSEAAENRWRRFSHMHEVRRRAKDGEDDDLEARLRLWNGNVRVEPPPETEIPATTKLPKGFLCMSPDGWEISTSQDRTRLIGKRGGEAAFRKRLKKGRIAHARSDGDGGWVVAVVDGRRLRLYRLRADGKTVGAPANAGLEMSPRILGASRGFVILDGDDGFRCVDLIERRQYASRKAAAVTVLDLPNHNALVLTHAYCGNLPARVCLHSPGARDFLSRIDGLRLSTDTIIHGVEPEGQVVFLRTASIIEAGADVNDLAGPRLSLRLSTLRFDPADGSLWPEGESEEAEVGADFTCWTRFGDYVALGFHSGRIEIRRLGEAKGTVAIAYVAGDLIRWQFPTAETNSSWPSPRAKCRGLTSLT